jgi:curved DNA-binding protein
VVVHGGLFVISPWRVLGRLAGAALRLLGRRLLGLPTWSERDRSDVTFPLQVTAAEARRGVRKRVTLRQADGDDDVVVTVPAGIRAGTRLRLRGKGRVLPGGDRGDAYLVVEIAG